MNFTKKTIALTVAAATVLTGITALGTRQVIGSQAADQCRVAVDSYVELAEAQEKDLSYGISMMEMIGDSPFAALGLLGQISTMGTDVSARWENLAAADDGYLESCVYTGFKGNVVDSYTIGIREEKWEAEFSLDNKSEEFEATRVRVFN